MHIYPELDNGYKRFKGLEQGLEEKFTEPSFKIKSKFIHSQMKYLTSTGIKTGNDISNLHIV